MNKLDRLHGEMGKSGGDGLIDAVSALTPANHRHGLQLRIELQQAFGLRFLDLRLDALSDRCAGDHDGLCRKIGRALSEPQRHLIRKPSVDPIGLARNRVRLMNHRRDLRPPSRLDGSRGSETTHTQNRVGAKGSEYPATSKKAV